MAVVKSSDGFIQVSFDPEEFLRSSIQIPPGTFIAGSVLRLLVDQKLEGTPYGEKIRRCMYVKTWFDGDNFIVEYAL